MKNFVLFSGLVFCSLPLSASAYFGSYYASGSSMFPGPSPTLKLSDGARSLRASAVTRLNVSVPLVVNWNFADPMPASIYGGVSGFLFQYQFYYGDQFLDLLQYRADVTFGVAPWIGGLVTNSNRINAFGLEVWDYAVANAVSTYVLEVSIVDRRTGECLWCESITGNARVSGRIFSAGSYFIATSVEFVPDGIPEPSNFALATTGLAAAGFAHRLRKLQSQKQP